MRLLDETADQCAEREALQGALLRYLDTIDRIAGEEGVAYFLAGGSALGAAREGALIPWDTDIDLIVPKDDYDRLVAALVAHLPSDLLICNPKVDPSYEHLFSRVTPSGINHNLAHIDIFPAVGASRFVVGRWLEVRAARLLNTLYMLRIANPEERYFYDARKRSLARLVRLVTAPLHPAVLRTAFSWLCRRAPGAHGPWAFNPCGSYLDREVLDANQLSVGSYAPLSGKSYPVPRDLDRYLTFLYGDYMSPPPDDRVRAELEFLHEVKLPSLRAALMANQRETL